MSACHASIVILLALNALPLNLVSAEEHDQLSLFQKSFTTRMRRDPTNESDGSVDDVFENIYQNQDWGAGESLSGPGSSLKGTESARACLGRWIEEFNVKILMDIPSGDGHWQALIPGISSISYVGYDISKEAVELARLNNKDHMNMQFDQLDLSKAVPVLRSSNLTEEKPDLIVVRDVIQHLPLDLGQRMLLNAKRTGARYLAVTSFANAVNQDISAGEFYKNNVHAEPFNLVEPLRSCPDTYYDIVGGKLWPLSESDDMLELIDLSLWNVD
jgi:SAM-dependent methyltransferase